MKYVPQRLIAVLALVGVFFTLTHAAEARGKGGAGKKPPPKVPYTAIVAVDTTAKTITVEPKNSTATGTRTYKFTDKTVITTSGRPGTVSDLTPGQQIHVGAGMDPDVADELKVTPPPADPEYSGHKEGAK